MDWTEDRISTLAKLWREGFSASQVARQLGGVSRSAVIGKVHRLGLAGRELPSRPAASTRAAARVRASAGGVRRQSAPRAQRPETPAAPRVAFEVAPTATLTSLTESGCRWPIGDPGEAGFGFCGRLRNGAGVYCAGHAPMATRRRETPMKTKEIDHIVSRYVESANWSRSGGGREDIRALI